VSSGHRNMDHSFPIRRPTWHPTHGPGVSIQMCGPPSTWEMRNIIGMEGLLFTVATVDVLQALAR